MHAPWPLTNMHPEYISFVPLALPTTGDVPKHVHGIKERTNEDTREAAAITAASNAQDEPCLTSLAS